MTDLLLDLTLRGSLASALVLGAARWKLIPVSALRIAFLLAALAFLLPIRIPVDSTALVALGSQEEAGSAIASAPTTALPSTDRAATAEQPVDWASWLLGVWATGAVVGLLRIAASSVAVHRRYGRLPLCTDSATLELLEHLKQRTGIHIPFGVVLVDEPIAPALWGVLRPRLLLPRRSWDRLDSTQREAVLLHELSHARSGDLIARWLLSLVGTIHWFNPFAHWLRRAQADLQEVAADAYALGRSRTSPQFYAETLLTVIRDCAESPRPPSAAVSILESPRSFQTRIEAMKSKPTSPRHPVLATVTTFAAITAIALFQPFVTVRADEAAEKQAAVDAMMPWLQLCDEGEYGESYDEASKAFKAAVTREHWIASAEGVRKPLGKLKSRELRSTALMTNLPNGTKGTYVVAQFKSSFANLAAATETVTFEKETDNQWRAAGYYIRPN